MQSAGSKIHSKRFPCWLKRSARVDRDFIETKELISRLMLNTVCQSARCPNIYKCFAGKRCTFLILGDTCTRSCRFCAVKKGACAPEVPDRAELLKIKQAVKELGLEHVIVTSVTRDDLADGGAGFFADCIGILKELDSHVKIEVLVPDFLGNEESIKKVVLAKPDIFSHNLETVPRLYGKVRPEADYMRSLEVLKLAKKFDNSIIAKSGIMAGLGEFREEVLDAMRDLKEAGCDIITIGQYLKPAVGCLEVEEFLDPSEFERFSKWAKELGFKEYYCGPFVRSSFA